jgi:hypothetical protein
MAAAISFAHFLRDNLRIPPGAGLSEDRDPCSANVSRGVTDHPGSVDPAESSPTIGSSGADLLGIANLRCTYEAALMAAMSRPVTVGRHTPTADGHQEDLVRCARWDCAAC